MPFPAAETVRKAVEIALHAGLEGIPGRWFATTDEGREIAFRPSGETFEVVVSLPDDEIESVPDTQIVEKTYRFRIAVHIDD